MHKEPLAEGRLWSIKVTEKELEAFFKNLGLAVPDAEIRDIVNILPFVEIIKKSVRKQRSFSTEPAFKPTFRDSSS